MAGEAEGTAGNVIGAVSPALSAIPYVGTILSAAGGIASGLLKQSAAKKQAEQAERMRKEALATQKQKIRPEFAEKQRLEKMSYLAGLPALEQSKKTLEENTASNLRAIREYSPNGAATLAAISAGLSAQGAASNKLSIENAQYKAGQLDKIGSTSWAIGEKQRQLEDIRDKQMATGLFPRYSFIDLMSKFTFLLLFQST